MKDLGLYIHIPFCERKCFYCDFTSFPEKGDEISRYIDYLIKELSLYKDKINSGFSISSIFIGGGTPSSIDDDYIEQILSYAFNNYNIKENMEVSIEVNPGSLTLEKAKKYKNVGINRISMGLQSLNNELLKSIGRIHNSDDFYKSYEILKTVGFENINIDLMFGLPDQKLEDLLDTINKVIQLDITHISLYSLILEPETHLNKLYEEGRLNMPTEDEDREMYHKAVSLLKESGYGHYEVSNFSKSGFKCLQNMTYWKVNPYLGVGINSHSNMDNNRLSNVDDFKNYYYKLDRDQFPLNEIEFIPREMEIGEYIILGLRLIEGINKSEFRKRFDIDIEELYREQISKNVNNGLLIEVGNTIRFTELGLDLSNQVELDFFP